MAVTQGSQPLPNLAGLTFPDITYALAHRLPGISISRSEDVAPRRVAPQVQQPPTTAPGGPSTGLRAINTPASARGRHYCPVEYCGFSADRIRRVRHHVENEHHTRVASTEDVTPNVVANLQEQLPIPVYYQDIYDPDTEADRPAIAGPPNDSPGSHGSPGPAYPRIIPEGFDWESDSDDDYSGRPGPSHRPTARKSTSGRTRIKVEPASM